MTKSELLIKLYDRIKYMRSPVVADEKKLQEYIDDAITELYVVTNKMGPSPCEQNEELVLTLDEQQYVLLAACLNVIKECARFAEDECSYMHDACPELFEPYDEFRDCMCDPWRQQIKYIEGKKLNVLARMVFAV